MKTYVAFLRGVNVAGKNKIKMSDLKRVMAAMGLKVEFSYIQSGNIVFSSAETSVNKLREDLESVLAKSFNETINVAVVEDIELEIILQNHPMAFKLDNKKIYYTLMLDMPSEENKSKLKNKILDEDLLVINNKVIYWVAKNGYSKNKINNNFIERILNVPTTTRNFNTLNNILLKIKQNQF